MCAPKTSALGCESTAFHTDFLHGDDVIENSLHPLQQNRINDRYLLNVVTAAQVDRRLCQPTGALAPMLGTALPVWRDAVNLSEQ